MGVICTNLANYGAPPCGWYIQNTPQKNAGFTRLRAAKVSNSGSLEPRFCLMTRGWNAMVFLKPTENLRRNEEGLNGNQRRQLKFVLLCRTCIYIYICIHVYISIIYIYNVYTPWKSTAIFWIVFINGFFGPTFAVFLAGNPSTCAMPWPVLSCFAASLVLFIYSMSYTIL